MTGYSDELKDENRAQPEPSRTDPWAFAMVPRIVTQGYHYPKDNL